MQTDPDQPSPVPQSALVGITGRGQSPCHRLPREGQRSMRPGLPRPHLGGHVIVIVMGEHRVLGKVTRTLAGRSNRPRQGRRRDAYRAISHPSLPNYIALDERRHSRASRRLSRRRVLAGRPRHLQVSGGEPAGGPMGGEALARLREQRRLLGRPTPRSTSRKLTTAARTTSRWERSHRERCTPIWRRDGLPRSRVCANTETAARRSDDAARRRGDPGWGRSYAGSSPRGNYRQATRHSS